MGVTELFQETMLWNESYERMCKFYTGISQNPVTVVAYSGNSWVSPAVSNDCVTGYNYKF